jgi:hypothetical protein
VCFTLQDLEKLVFSHFRTSRRAPGTHLGMCLCPPDPPYGVQKRSRALSGTPQGLPRTPLEHPCEFQVGNCFIENRRLQHFTRIMHHFHQYSTTIFGLQIGPCQLLHIFGCDFQKSENSSHLGSFPRTPSCTFLDPLARHGLPSSNKF